MLGCNYQEYKEKLLCLTIFYQKFGKTQPLWEGAWGGLNQPTAGARFEQTLPKGDQPFQLYTLPTPNGIKATIMLEELKELGVTQAGYDAYRIKIGDGDQFGSDFVSINPNSKDSSHDGLL